MDYFCLLYQYKIEGKFQFGPLWHEGERPLIMPADGKIAVACSCAADHTSIQRP